MTEARESQSGWAGKMSAEFRHTFRALGQRNFRLYFSGQLISLSGTWMQSLALSWLVYRLTRSSMDLGIVDFCAQIPVLALALLGGWLADRVDRRFILCAAQMTMMLQSALLAYLVFSGQIQFFQILLLSLLFGIANAFEMPARQSLIAVMVEPEYLVNAISLNSSVFNASRVVGPAIAAYLVGVVGEGYCFVINSLSFIAALIAIAMMKLPKRTAEADGVRGNVLEGIKFAAAHKDIAPILRMTSFMSLLGAQFFVLLPVVVREVLHKEVDAFGILRAAIAAGSLVGALFLASKGSQDTLKKIVSFCSLGFPLSLMLFAVSPSFAFTVILMLVLGFCLTVQLSGSHSLLQLNCPDHLRGRLMSIWTITFLGVSPLGSLLTGYLASKIGALPTIGLSGILCLLSAIVYVIFKK